MPTPFVPVTPLARSHVEAYTRLAWFLFECLEREHLLNLKALAECRPDFVSWWMPHGVVASRGALAGFGPPTPHGRRGAGSPGPVRAGGR